GDPRLSSIRLLIIHSRLEFSANFWGGAKQSVEAMRAGAIDYLTKPYGTEPGKRWLAFAHFRVKYICAETTPQTPKEIRPQTCCRNGQRRCCVAFKCARFVTTGLTTNFSPERLREFAEVKAAAEKLVQKARTNKTAQELIERA